MGGLGAGMTALLLLLLVGVTVAVPAADRPLPAFTSVRVCTPINVVIAPSKGSAYSLTIDGDSSVAPAVKAAVKSNVLSLGTEGSFKTQRPVKVVVR